MEALFAGRGQAQPVPRPVRVRQRAQGRFQLPSDSDGYARRNLDHRHHVPRRTAVDVSVHRRADRRTVQAAPQAGRPQGHNQTERVLPLYRKGPQGGREVHGAWVRLPADHKLDQGQRKGLRARQTDGHQGDGHPRQLLRLPHLQKDEPHAQSGEGKIFGDSQGGARQRHRPALPLRGHHTRRLLRLRRAVRVRADEAAPRERHRRQDQGVRHLGLRHQLSRRHAAAQRPGHHQRSQILRRGPQ